MVSFSLTVTYSMRTRGRLYRYTRVYVHMWYLCRVQVAWSVPCARSEAVRARLDCAIYKLIPIDKRAVQLSAHDSDG